MLNPYNTERSSNSPRSPRSPDSPRFCEKCSSLKPSPTRARGQDDVSITRKLPQTTSKAAMGRTIGSLRI